MGQTFVRHAGHSEENEGIPWQGDLTLQGREGEVKRYSSIVTMALSRVVSEIFNVEKCRDLEIRVRVTQGH